MATIEEKIHNWQQIIVNHTDKIVIECTEIFLARIPKDTLPTLTDLEQAASNIQDKAISLLTNDEILATLEITDLAAKESLSVSWLSLMPKLTVPIPQTELKLKPWQLAAAGALGSLLGMFLFGGLLYWMLNMRDVGILLGGSIGAAALVYSIWWSSYNKTVRTGLALFLGAATGLELFTAFAGIGFGGLWRQHTGTGGLVKRLFIYLGLLILLVFIRPQPHYERADFEHTIGHIIKQWINHGCLLLFSLATTEQHEVVQEMVLDPELARAIVDLHKSSTTDLALAAEAVLQEAQRVGIDNLNGTPQFATERMVTKRQFCWEDHFSKQYQRFGVIEAGDMVQVEKEPIVQNEVIIDLGLVRKVRKSKKH